MSLATISAALRAAGQAVFLVELEFDGYKRYYSTAPVEISGGPGFTPSLLSDPHVDFTFSLSGMRSADTTVQLTLANEERLQDLSKKRYLDAGTARLFLWADGLSWSDIEDYPTFVGSFCKGQHDLDELQFSIVDWASTKGKTISSLDAMTDDPGGLIQTLLETYSYLTLEQIDHEALGTMTAFCSPIQFSAAVDSTANTMDIIDRILAECCCGRGNRNGRFGPVVFDLKGPARGRLTDKDLVGRSARFDATPRELVVNDLKVEYGYSEGSLDSSFTVDFTNNGVCERSYWDYGPTQQYNLRLPDCPDEASARWCSGRFLDFRAVRHDLVLCRVPHWIGLAIQEGDIYELTLEGGASVSGEGWSAKRCVLLDRSFVPAGIDQRWMRIATN